VVTNVSENIFVFVFIFRIEIKTEVEGFFETYVPITRLYGYSA
jgi:hypothetical protein